MNRLAKDDYNEAESYLKRYKQNEKDIRDITDDIISLDAASTAENRSSNIINDTVLNKVIELDSNEWLKKAIKEYKLVNRVLEMASEKANFVFQEYYKKKKSKWEVIAEGIAERTFERKKKELIYNIHKELKKEVRCSQ